MTTFTRSFERTREAGEDLSAAENHIVQLDASGLIEVAEGATDLVVGVLTNKPAAGEPALYQFLGTAPVKAGGAITVGAWITTNANGEAVATTTAGDVVIGRALQSAADGDVFEVQLGIHTLATAA